MNNTEERKQRTLDYLAECEAAIGKMRAEVEGGGRLSFLSLVAKTEDTYFSNALALGTDGAAAHGLYMRTHADKLCDRAQQMARIMEEVEPQE